MHTKPKPEITVDGATFYSAERAGEIIGVNKRTIQRWIAQGTVKASHVGQFTFISAPELRRLLTEGDGATRGDPEEADKARRDGHVPPSDSKPGASSHSANRKRG